MNRYHEIQHETELCLTSPKDPTHRVSMVRIAAARLVCLESLTIQHRLVVQEQSCSTI